MNMSSYEYRTLQWRHNDDHGISNHQPHDCLLNRLFRRRLNKTSKLRVTGLCVGNSPWPVNSPHFQLELDFEGHKSFMKSCLCCIYGSHDDVIKWKHFLRYWPFVRGIHQSPVNSPHKGQWRRALMFSFFCLQTNGWANNREAGDLRRHRAHYEVIVMIQWEIWLHRGSGTQSFYVHVNKHLNHKQFETHECILSNVAPEALMLKHLAIIIDSADKIFSIFD